MITNNSSGISINVNYSNDVAKSSENSRKRKQDNQSGRETEATTSQIASQSLSAAVAGTTSSNPQAGSSKRSLDLLKQSFEKANVKLKELETQARNEGTTAVNLINSLYTSAHAKEQLLLGQITQLMKALEEADVQNEKLKKKAHDITAHFEKAKADWAGERAEIARMEKAISTEKFNSKNELIGLKAQIDKLKNDNASLEKEKESLKKENIKLANRCTTLERQVSKRDFDAMSVAAAESLVSFARASVENQETSTSSSSMTSSSQTSIISTDKEKMDSEIVYDESSKTFRDKNNNPFEGDGATSLKAYIYSGNHKKGRWYGEGVLIYNNITAKGFFNTRGFDSYGNKEDLKSSPNGNEVTIKSDDGWQFRGYLSKGKPTGKCTITCPDESSIHVNYVNFQRKGTATIKTKDGESYEVSFKDDAPKTVKPGDRCMAFGSFKDCPFKEFLEGAIALFN